MNLIEMNNILKSKIKDELVLNVASKILSSLDNVVVDTRNFLNRKDYFYSIVSSVAYLSYIKIKQPKSLDEIAILFEVERKEIGRTYKRIKKILNIKNCNKENMSILSTSCVYLPKPEDYVRILNFKWVSEKVKEDTFTIIRLSEDNSSINPVSKCAASAYVSFIINNDKKTIREIADIFSLTETTLSKNIRFVFDKIEKTDFFKNSCKKYFNNLNSKKELKGINKRLVKNNDDIK